jgi:hypothetical protein
MERRKVIVKNYVTSKNYQRIDFDDYNGNECSLQESSATIDGNDPGCSFLWLGKGIERMHLSRDMVKELIGYMENWLKNERLFK